MLPSRTALTAPKVLAARLLDIAVLLVTTATMAQAPSVVLWPSTPLPLRVLRVLLALLVLLVLRVNSWDLLPMAKLLLPRRLARLARMAIVVLTVLTAAVARAAFTTVAPQAALNPTESSPTFLAPTSGALLPGMPASAWAVAPGPVRSLGWALGWPLGHGRR